MNETSEEAGRREAAYFESMVRERLPTVVRGLVVAIALYAGFGVLDFYLFPEVAGLLLLLRLVFIATALGLIGLVRLRREYFVRRAQAWLVGATLVGGAGIILMGHIVAPLPRGDVYYAGIVLTIVFSTVYFPIRFAYVVANSVLLIIGYNLSIAFSHEDLAVAACNNCFLVATAAACGLGCRNSERLFLQKWRDHDLISRQKAEIEAQRRRADGLLGQILPESIARRMMAGEEQIADGHADVTLLFADLSGFTEMASTVSPHALVRLLNRVFSAFDEVAGRVGAEKIKTIGDGYMAVCGAPTEVEDHPDRMIRMAVAMLVELEKVRLENPGLALRVRIGIHTGPCVAGIIGKKRFAYDLWGDTVNIASRMESTGVPGRIQVSEATYLRVQHRHRFEPRREVEVKGRGRMNAYLLDLSPPAAA